MQKCLYCFILEHGWLFQLPAAVRDWGQAGKWAAHVTQALQGRAQKHHRLLNLNSGHLLNCILAPQCFHLSIQHMKDLMT